jgi:GxxExxY protein
MRDIDDLTRDVIGVAIRLHSQLGPGMLESVYETLLAGRLVDLGFSVDRQMPIHLEFDGVNFSDVARVDLLIDKRLVLEIKSVERFHPVHAKQLLTYLRLLNLPVGLLINFGEVRLKDGIRRMVNNHIDLPRSASSAPLRET